MSNILGMGASGVLIVCTSVTNSLQLSFQFIEVCKNCSHLCGSLSECPEFPWIFKITMLSSHTFHSPDSLSLFLLVSFLISFILSLLLCFPLLRSSCQLSSPASMRLHIFLSQKWHHRCMMVAAPPCLFYDLV